jgi:hypothetical protein
MRQDEEFAAEAGELPEKDRPLVGVDVKLKCAVRSPESGKARR